MGSVVEHRFSSPAVENLYAMTEARSRRRRPDDLGTEPDPADLMTSRAVIKALHNVYRALLILAAVVAVIGIALVVAAWLPG